MIGFTNQAGLFNLSVGKKCSELANRPSETTNWRPIRRKNLRKGYQSMNFKFFNLVSITKKYKELTWYKMSKNDQILKYSSQVRIEKYST